MSKERPLILVSNDDGISAPGIRHLIRLMQKLGDVWDIAEASIYLAHDTGSFITGEILTIDGGMSQWGVVWPAGMPDYFKMNGGD